MKIAIDPNMHRHVPLLELPRFVQALGYDWIELSPRADFLDWWVNPRVYPERLRDFKKALRDADVKIAALLPMYRWASPHPVERLAPCATGRAPSRSRSRSIDTGQTRRLADHET